MDDTQLSFFLSRFYCYRYLECNENIWIHDHDKYCLLGEFSSFYNFILIFLTLRKRKYLVI